MLFYLLLLGLPIALVLLIVSLVIRLIIPKKRHLNTLALWATLSLVAGIVLAVLYKKENVTVYAKNYSEPNFRQVTIGMTEQQVLNLVGKPLATWAPYRNTNFRDRQDYVGFVYSKSESDGDYELRHINFDKGKVVEIRSYYYYD